MRDICHMAIERLHRLATPLVRDKITSQRPPQGPISAEPEKSGGKQPGLIDITKH